MADTGAVVDVGVDAVVVTVTVVAAGAGELALN